MAAALFLALSPLLHGFHLVNSHHSHNLCAVCNSGNKNHSHGLCHGSSHLSLITSISIPGSDCSGGHDPDTCPLCQYFNKLMRNQFVLHSPAADNLQESYLQEQYPVFFVFYTSGFLNIIPRAPPCHSS
jgi:hypothetical protein